MTNKPSKPINLFDCATSQKVIGQENFLNAFKTILNHGGYAQGPETRELDQKLADYSGTKFCATCGSGTDALTLALMAWDVKPGDAVFVSSFTFVASAEAPVLLGATPIFVDSDPNTYNMNPKDLENIGFFSVEEIFPNGNFLVDEDGITYTFNEYEIAAYVVRETNVFLPYAEILYLLKKDSPIAKLIDN